MTPLTLVESVFNVIALQTFMPGVCTSGYIVLLLKALVSKEFIPVACLIQQEETLMSVLGYIVMTIPVSLSFFTHLEWLLGHMQSNLQVWYYIISIYY